MSSQPAEDYAKQAAEAAKAAAEAAAAEVSKGEPQFTHGSDHTEG